MPSRRFRTWRGFLSLLAVCAPVIALAGWGQTADQIIFDDTMEFLERYGVLVAMGLYFVWLFVGHFDKQKNYVDQSSKKGR